MQRRFCNLGREPFRESLRATVPAHPDRNPFEIFSLTPASASYRESPKSSFLRLNLHFFWAPAPTLPAPTAAAAIPSPSEGTEFFWRLISPKIKSCWQFDEELIGARPTFFTFRTLLPLVTFVPFDPAGPGLPGTPGCPAYFFASTLPMLWPASSPRPSGRQGAKALPVKLTMTATTAMAMPGPLIPQTFSSALQGAWAHSW